MGDNTTVSVQAARVSALSAEGGDGSPAGKQSALQALCLIARLHQIAADPEHLAHELCWPHGDQPSSADLVLTARHLGLKAKLSRSTVQRLALAPLPALATLRVEAGTTRTVVLAHCDGQRVLFQDLFGAVQGGRPVIKPLSVFESQWTGELILIASRASLAGDIAKFDFSWFIPSLVKYRRLFGEVLIVSLFLQLFALVSPLFFQVVMDKVLVHRGLTTLDVLVVGLLVVVVFESVLNTLRPYVVDNAGESITELTGRGTDAVESSIAWTLVAELETLTLTGSGAINGTGNALANTINGNSAANRIDGGMGADKMAGGAGSDTYVVDNAGDTVTEASSAGTDTVESSISWTLGAQIENLTLTGAGAINATGNTLANTLRDNAGNNILDGGTGSDTMIGGAGDDVYKVDATTDVLTEAANEGRDRVETTVTLTLASNVEDLTLLGSATINGTGNSLDNVLIGNSAANTLTGGAGNDSLNGNAGANRLVGGAGNDTHFVDNTADVTTEAANEGSDSVNSTVTWTLGANLENLTLLGTTAINGTGNTLDNVLTGNSGANVPTGNAGNDVLDGGMGADTLIGGAGNDNYPMARG
jgi:hypothetical protein